MNFAPDLSPEGNLPIFLRQLFWDVDAADFKPLMNPSFTIARILECGDEKACGWMRRKFDESLIVSILKKSRTLSRKSANFWAVFFKIDKNEVRCLNKEFQEKQGRIWPY